MCSQEWKRILIFVFPRMEEDPHFCVPKLLLPPSPNQFIPSFHIFSLCSIRHCTCSKPINKAQQMALNLVVGAFKFIIAVITCPKDISSPNKLCLGPCFLVTYFHSRFLFLSLLSCYNRVICSTGSCTYSSTVVDGAVAEIDELEGGGATLIGPLPASLGD